MQKQSILSRGLLRKALLLLTAFVCSASANAVTWVPIQLEQEVSVVPFVDAFYTITPTEDGIMKLVTVSGSATNAYAVTTTGLTYTDGSVNTSWSYGTESSKANLSFAVTAGTTYYISLNFPMDAWTFKATMGEAFAFTGSNPADGAVYSITSNETVFLYFTSTSVTFTEGEVYANENLIKVYNFNDYNALVANGTFTYTQEGTSGIVDWNGNLCAREENGIALSFTTATGRGYYNVLNRLYDEGRLKENDPIRLCFHGVKDRLTGKLLNGDGEIELTWIFGGAPTTLVSAKMPEVIKSWFNEGDPEAIATFTFSRPIQSARASLEMGQGEGADDLYYEELPTDKISFEGNTVSIDLSGVMRTKETMNLKYNWTNFTLSLFSVVDEEGNGTLSEDLGSASSYSYIIGYRNISTDIASEFTPQSGTTLTDSNQSIEIWFNNSDIIEWDGVTFTYYTEEMEAIETFIPKAQLSVTVEDNETVITAPIPQGYATAPNLRVAVNVTLSQDGKAHNIVAYYNTTLSHDLDLVRYADPADGSTLSVLKEIHLTLGSTYAINDRMPLPQVKVHGKNTGRTLNATIKPDGMTNAKIVLDETITEADTYTLDISAGVIGDYIYGESGFHSGITNSRCTLTYTVDGRYEGKPVIIDPAEGEVSQLQTFSLTFFEYASVAPTWDNNARPYLQDDTTGQRHYGQFADGTNNNDSYEPTAPNTVIFTLDSKTTTPGSYTLTIPAGAICNGSTGDPLETTYTFAYTITESAAINNPTTGENPNNPQTPTYNLSGQKVSPDYKGLIIRNGKKFLAK